MNLLFNGSQIRVSHSFNLNLLHLITQSISCTNWNNAQYFLKFELNHISNDQLLMVLNL